MLITNHVLRDALNRDTLRCCSDPCGWKIHCSKIKYHNGLISCGKGSLIENIPLIK